MANPGQQELIQIKRIFRYLKGTVSHGLLFRTRNNPPPIVHAYCDADFAGSGPEGKRVSTSGFTLLINNGPISWSSKRQSIVALSTAEAEYISAADCVKDVQYVKDLLAELTGKPTEITLFMDNQSTIKMIKAGQLNKSTKHIQVRFYHLNAAYVNNLFVLDYIPTNDNISDIFTKPLTAKKFQKFKTLLVTSLDEIQQSGNVNKTN